MSEQEIKTIQSQLVQLSGDIRNLQETLQPIADIYTTVSKLGKWAAVLLGTLGATIAILVGIKSIFGNK